jgi:hypothetical protein
MNDDQLMFNLFGPFSGQAVSQYPELAAYHGYFGFWSAFFTGMVALIVAGMTAERWYTRSILHLCDHLCDLNWREMGRLVQPQ